MRVTRENLNACKAFVDFWEDHVIIPSVRVFYRHPSLQKKPLMVMCLMSDDFNVFKIHMMMMLVHMARKFGVMVEHQNSLFVLRNPRLQCSCQNVLPKYTSQWQKSNTLSTKKLCMFRCIERICLTDDPLFHWDASCICLKWSHCVDIYNPIARHRNLVHGSRSSVEQPSLIHSWKPKSCPRCSPYEDF